MSEESKNIDSVKLTPTMSFNPFDEVEEKLSEEIAVAYKETGSTSLPVVATNKEQESKREDVVSEDDEKVLEEEKVEEETEEEEASPVSLLEFYKDDEIFKIPEDAIIKMRADGKEIKVPLKDLRDHKAGAVAWDRKFTQLSQKFKEVESAKNEITTKENQKVQLLKEFEDLHGKGDTLQALEVLGELLGKEDPIAFAESQVGAFSKFFEKFENLSADQIKNIFLDNRTKSLQRRAQSQKTRADEESARYIAFKEYNALKAEHNFTDDDFSEAFEILKKGGRPENQIGMKDVVEVVKDRFLMEDIIAAERDAKATLSDKHRASFFSLVKETLNKGEEVSYSDVVEMLKQIKNKAKEADPKTVETLNRKVQKSPKTSMKTTPKKAASDQREILSWGDLEDIYKL